MQDIGRGLAAGILLCRWYVVCREVDLSGRSPPGRQQHRHSRGSGNPVAESSFCCIPLRQTLDNVGRNSEAYCAGRSLLAKHQRAYARIVHSIPAFGGMAELLHWAPSRTLDAITLWLLKYAVCSTLMLRPCLPSPVHCLPGIPTFSAPMDTLQPNP